MPDRLYQRPAPPPKDENVSGKRISPKTFLHLQRQSAHPATHVGMPGGDPDPHTPREPGSLAQCRQYAAQRAEIDVAADTHMLSVRELDLHHSRYRGGARRRYWAHRMTG